MPLNNASPNSTARFPFGRVLINGAPLANWERIEVTKNTNYISDTWEIETPLNGLPSQFQPSFWASQTDIEVTVQAGFKNNDGSLGTPSTLVVGLADEVDLDFIAFGKKQTFRCRGRDYSGALIDSIVSENYINLTSSQVAQKILANHPQLTGDIKATKIKIGTYFNNETSTATQRQTEWDLLTKLAQYEGYVVLIQGKTLYFGPSPTPNTANPYIFKYVPPANDQTIQANMLSLRCNRALTLARDVKVIVQTFNYATGKTVKKTAIIKNKNRSGSAVGPQTYTYNMPNLTPDQAQQKAQSLALLISNRERIIEIDAPGDTALTMQTVVQLTGTATDFDQNYFVDRLTHTLDVEGYMMSLRAKNHSPYSTLET
jgi:phage protein D